MNLLVDKYVIRYSQYLNNIIPSLEHSLNYSYAILFLIQFSNVAHKLRLY